MVRTMVPKTAPRSAHLTALPTAQQMKRQKAQLAGRLPAHRSDTQTAYQTAQWMVLQMAQCSARLTAPSTVQLMAPQKVPQTEHLTAQRMGQLTAPRWSGHSLQHGRQRDGRHRRPSSEQSQHSRRCSRQKGRRRTADSAAQLEAWWTRN